MDQSVLIFAGVVILMVVGLVLVYARGTNKRFAELVPADIAHRAFDTADKLIVASLPGIAATPDQTDDEVALAFLGIRGWKVTGSPETGYTAVKDVEPVK